MRVLRGVVYMTKSSGPRTVQKFSSGGSGFDPSFSKAEKVRVVACFA